MSNYSINTSIIINASPEKVREVFLDFSTYKEWSAFIQSIEPVKDNSINPGDNLNVGLSFEQEGTSITKLQPVILTNSATEFSWKGVLLSSYIFEGSHKFEFNPVQGDSNKTELVHSEQFAGALKYPLLYFIKDKTEKNFQRFNEAIKSRAETS
ncbi:hypothetical protein BN7_2132 [Wickerhamomyces ciferrii]|uniref:SRPBCC domain-containing protein n=1 Tax=Wickerhamomyces ciferrii (strain ATCC 14091 / BCRC 22168 / CBS 111 / JCM 3599 / NBRC 0793 / NRRL Y-1031 F-60-10) TaxID=1206466 RepID=K0KN83_WICCF|nr:uncharacterized protein BN7_2132 [Wickerhamomyces ciferrii]CCH42588.1 hypothetical protein BN7_2132 [Wickerhamomyces ciferrii]